MAFSVKAHQYAGDARVPFAFGGSGSGHVRIEADWSASEVATAAGSQKIWKAAKNCYLKNFGLRVPVMDSHATPTLEWDVGSTDGGAEFITTASTTVGEVGGYRVINIPDESTVAGTYMAAGGIIYLTNQTKAATGVAGTVEVAFDVTYI